jgi:hypothetical protein
MTFRAWGAKEKTTGDVVSMLDKSDKNLQMSQTNEAFSANA